MSSNKKSLGGVILLLIIFLAIAGGSWYFFNGNKDSSGDVDAAAQSGGMSSIADNSTATNTGAQSQGTNPIGQKGTVQELPVNPLLGRRGVGDPNAPIKIQEFYSLTCNHCATFHKDIYPLLKEKYIDTGKVYFVYEEFPLNGPALYGSMIARCLPTEGYVGFIGLLLKNQDIWAFSGDFKDALRQNSMLAGMGPEEFDACFNNKELQKAIGLNIKTASELWKISSTPTFVFNDGEMILRGSHNLDNFDTVIADLLAEDTVKEDPPSDVIEEVAEEAETTVQ